MLKLRTLKTANGRDIEPISDVLLDFLGSDVDCNRLKIQLLMVPDMIKTAFTCELPVKEVTNVRTIAKSMKQSEIYKGMFSEIYFTFPATEERWFSSLRRLKTSTKLYEPLQAQQFVSTLCSLGKD